MIDSGLSPATINRRLSALRSILALARQFGLINFELDVSNTRHRPYRDTRGPGVQGVATWCRLAARQRPAKAARDIALARMMYDLGLRRSETLRLNLADLDVRAGRVWIIGKGRSGEREALTLPARTIEALNAWVRHRGKHPGALFESMDRARKGDGRLTGNGLYSVVRALAKKADVVLRPHAIRHVSITSALDATNGNVRAVRHFSRHASLDVVALYDDLRTDQAGSIATLVADTLNVE